MVPGDIIVNTLKADRNHLHSAYGVKRIGIFGSYAKGTPTEHSDIDLVMEFDKPIGLDFMKLTAYLEKKLGRKADVLTPAGINSIRNRRIKEEIQRSIVYV